LPALQNYEHNTAFRKLYLLPSSGENVRRHLIIVVP